MAFDDPSLFINRELSMLAFQRRVLDEARDLGLPLYERLKFIGIAASNMDEFFMVRLSGIKQQIVGGVLEKSADGLLPQEQLLAISEQAHAFVAEQYRVWNELQPDLADKGGVRILSGMDLTPEQLAVAREYFAGTVFPALTPLAVDPGHPFPHLRNKSLNVAVFLKRKETGAAPKRKKGKKQAVMQSDNNIDISVAVVQMPGVLPRLVPLATDKGRAYLPLDSRQRLPTRASFRLGKTRRL